LARRNASRASGSHHWLPWVLTAAALSCGGGDAPVDEADEAHGDPSAEEAAESDRRREALKELNGWEATRRAEADFAALPPWSEAAGPDPFRVRLLADGTRLGLLRGRGALVRMDAAGNEIGQVPTFVDATAWATNPEATVLYVVGPRQGSVQRFALPSRADEALRRIDTFTVADSWSLRDVAVGPQGRLALADPYAHRVMVTPPPPLTDGAQPSTTQVQPVFVADCGGPLQVQWTATRLLALCTLDHTLTAWPLNPDGLPTADATRIEHDGPIWTMAAQALPASDGTVRVALGGVEDHALDRSDGAFGYIDSFVFVADIPRSGPAVRRAELNISALGAITPKWISLALSDTGTSVRTVGYGGDVLVEADWPPGFGAPTSVETTPWVPGVTDIQALDDGALLAANPLLDAWVTLREGETTVSVVPDPGPSRGWEERLGEALLFTGLMAPQGHSEGKASRFTCETCHFEGAVDGRVHWTGRGEVFASTRPLRGLFNNNPHFSRALDATMTDMVHNEFRVASRGTGADPWFTLDPSDAPWLSHIGVTQSVDGQGLRQALMTFIMTFTHEPNPRAAAGSGAAEVGEGAKLFETLCEGCHAARLVTGTPSTRVPPSAWLDHVASPNGPIVWATDERKQTGVVPYVHADGARVPSLRRLYAKRPYFTDGKAATLQAATDRFSVGAAQHVRDAAGGRNITEDERRALQRFLELL